LNHDSLSTTIILWVQSLEKFSWGMFAHKSEFIVPVGGKFACAKDCGGLAAGTKGRSQHA
ncbi:MAG: hypothetical protein OXP75_02070, partial [Rhodospirillales bacterium]|nr:hypothetical protein [Rhodospirillales bacterium]